MREQLDLIVAGEWDVLVVLDACRADAYQQVVGRSEVVRSPAVCTAGWIKAVWPVFARSEGVRYYNANPVVDRTLASMDVAPSTFELTPMWRSLWGRHGAGRIPSVHPQAISGYIWANQCPIPTVVHYLQPHSPYIGDPPLALTRWGGSGGGAGGEFGEACCALTAPGRAVREGRTSWPEVREAYLGNLRLAWDAVQVLAGSFSDYRVVVTADHGEVLGEHGGRFGHECGWDFPELRAVPWHVIEPCSRDESTTREKLEALGYA